MGESFVHGAPEELLPYSGILERSIDGVIHRASVDGREHGRGSGTSTAQRLFPP